MFKIPPDKVRVIFIVNDKTEDLFLSFLFDLGYSWIERDFDTLATKLETIGTLLLRDTDTRLKKVFDKFYQTSGIVYYFIGTKEWFRPDTVDIYSHALYVSKDQWKDFNNYYRLQYGITYNDHLKEMK